MQVYTHFRVSRYTRSIRIARLSIYLHLFCLLIGYSNSIFILFGYLDSTFTNNHRCTKKPVRPKNCQMPKLQHIHYITKLHQNMER